MHTAATSADSVTKLLPGADHSLAHLSDSELLARTQHLVGTSNRVFAALLVHLAEVEARGLHRKFACSSLYTYCIYELRFSEDAASRRASAAKLVKRFPALFDAVAAGELHLTGLLMLGPHLTDENHVDVLGRAKFRTKKEIAKLVRTLAPLPDVPDCIEPLRPALPATPRNPTWAQFVESLCPPVRELAAGKRPRDWANDTFEPNLTGPGRSEPGGEGTNSTEPISSDAGAQRLTDTRAQAPAPALVGHPARELQPLTSPQLYQMQFTASEEHVELVQRAKALLSRTTAGSSLGELHLQAMRLLVAELEKKRFASGTRPREQRAPKHAAKEHPRQRGRYVPAAVRRAVLERDGGRCTYVDERGQRCRETHYLEIHHLKAHAKGGSHELENLALRCVAHNTLAAEQDFGREHVQRKRDASRHESQRRETNVASTPRRRGP